MSSTSPARKQNQQRLQIVDESINNEFPRETLEAARRRAFEYEKAKASSHRHDEGEGNWLVSYADMMTLLVGFFVLLFSFSKIDSGEFEKIKRETTKVFGGEYQVPFEKLSTELKKAVAEKNLTDQVFFTESDDGIQITFRGALFFDSGSAELKNTAGDLLEKLIPTIIGNAQGFGVLVEGHTDNRPMVGAVFASNWELSSVRACSVLRKFIENGFNPDHIKAIGYGDRRPVAPNEDKDGTQLLNNQSQNRRVVIKILKTFD